MTYDTKCHELAVYFLTDDAMEKGAVKGKLLAKCATDLAQQIQDLIESFMEADLVELSAEHERGMEAHGRGA